MISSRSTLLAFYFLIVGIIPAVHGQPQLQLPIACTPGKDCWVVNYVDVNPEPGSATDFHCGPLTYDGHDGTDFTIRDWVAMDSGVDVVAAADGTVLRLRDGVEDRLLSANERRKVLEQDRGCGNGVFIDHGGGWQTIYCHMKKDSIVVAPGDQVKAGQKIGTVGHSGFVEFPHLHLGVFFEKEAIDPFTGLGSREGCNGMKEPLWLKDLSLDYQPVSIYATGFRDSVPDFEAIKKDARTPEQLPPDASALTFWAGLFGAMKDDRIHLEILDPHGGVFAQQDIVQEKTRARQFYYTGRKTQGLASGTYTGTVRLLRILSGGETITREISRELLVK